MTALAARLRALFYRSSMNAELDEELAYHLDRETERNIASGMSAEEARYAARRSVGNITKHAERAREAYGWTWLEQLARDARYGARALRRSPVFTAVAVLSLALGMGANTMIFGVMYGVLFEPLPVQSPERLAELNRVAASELDGWFTYDELDALRGTPGIRALTAVRTIDNVAVVTRSRRSFSTLDLIDATFFHTIALRPLRGRLIDSADVATAAPVAVVSHAFAESEFGTVDDALGQTIRVHDVPVSIIGVAPRAFRGLEYPGYFVVGIPVTLAPSIGLQDLRRSQEYEFQGVVRIADGVDRRQAENRLDAAFQRCCLHAKPERLTLRDMTRGIGGGKDDAREEYTPLLAILMAGAAVVLLIACANVANLLIVRAAAREREIAVRMSLGASRSRVMRQLLVESLMLGALGGLAAIPFAAWGTIGVEQMIPANMSVYADIVRWHPKPTVLAFTALVSAACVTVFGLVPAFRGTRGNLSAALKTGGRGTVGGKRWLDRGVVIAQLSFALLLVSAASLLVTTLRNVARVDGGFSTSGVTIVSVETRGTRYERDGIVPIQGEILRRVRSIPGVSRAGMATMLPISGGRRSPVALDADGALLWQAISLTAVTPDYFASVGVSLVRGRDFTDRDDATSERVAIITEAVAQRAFPGRNALGAVLRIRGDSVHSLRVVGVVRDTKLFGLRGDRVPVVYAPVTQTGQWPFLGLVVRIPDGSETLTRQVLSAIEVSAPGVRVRKVSTMRGEIRDSMFTDTLAASIAALFGSLALVLAAIGIYGVVAFNVARRTNEIGVRIALGAQRREILSLVFGSAMKLVLAAVIVGGPLAFMAGRAMRAQLYGVSAHDPALLLLALATLVAVALAATFFPARRASRIDPLVALRAD